jgi:hypothetical protein
MIGSRGALRGAVAILPILLALALPPPPLQATTERPLKSVVAALEPAAGTTGDVTFVVGGDNRPTAKGAPMPRVVKTIFDEIALVRPAFVLWSGDTVYGYCDTRTELDGEYDAFLDLAKRGGAPLFNAPGNHEIHSGQHCPPSIPEADLCGPPCSEKVFEKSFGRLYGSFDYAGAHFISLDTDVPGTPDEISGAQLAWLKQDLEANKGARAIFIFCHTEFYSSPRIDPPQGQSHPAIFDRIALHELFRRYPVRAVFAGHEHLYWREPAENHDGIEYFVAGGAGAPFYASPDRGGFSHYVLVRLTGNRVSYDVIEPGHLYVEPPLAGLSGPPGKDGEARFWIVNSNEAGPLVLDGVETEVPATLGACNDLQPTSDFKGRDGKPVTLTVTSCAPGKSVHKLRIRAEGVPAGASVPVVVRRK